MRAYLGNLRLQRHISKRWAEGGRRPPLLADPEKWERFLHRTNALPARCVYPGCQLQAAERSYYCGGHQPRFLRVPMRHSGGG